ncbi:MAG: ABC transporter permease, partial [Pseudomonadota bacterium]
MFLFIARRLGVMALTVLCLTFIVFFLTNLEPNLQRLAKTQANNRMTDEQVVNWLTQRGYTRNVFIKYGEWMGVVPGWTNVINDVPEGRCKSAGVPQEEWPTYCGVLQGDLGDSTVFKDTVNNIIAVRLSLTGWLMLFVMIVMVPMALTIGVLA